MKYKIKFCIYINLTAINFNIFFDSHKQNITIYSNLYICKVIIFHLKLCRTFGYNLNEIN